MSALSLFHKAGDAAPRPSPARTFSPPPRNSTPTALRTHEKGKVTITVLLGTTQSGFDTRSSRVGKSWPRRVYCAGSARRAPHRAARRRRSPRRAPAESPLRSRTPPTRPSAEEAWHSAPPGSGDEVRNYTDPDLRRTTNLSQDTKVTRPVAKNCEAHKSIRATFAVGHRVRGCLSLRVAALVSFRNSRDRYTGRNLLLSSEFCICGWDS